MSKLPSNILKEKLTLIQRRNELEAEIDAALEDLRDMESSEERAIELQNHLDNIRHDLIMIKARIRQIDTGNFVLLISEEEEQALNRRMVEDHAKRRKHGPT